MTIQLQDFLIDPYRSTIFTAIFISVLVFAVRAKSWHEWLLIVCFVSGARIVFGTQTFFPLSNWELIRVDRCALEGLVWLLVSAAIFQKLNLEYSFRFLSVLGWVNFALLVAPPHLGLLSNPSMSGTFQALLIPFLYSRGGPLWVLSAVAIPFIKASNPIAILGVEILTLSLSLPFRWRASIFSLTGTGLAISVYFMGGLSIFLSGSGREELYQKAWQFWQSVGSPWILGTGTGTFPALAWRFPVSNSHFPFMHSDWQQILYEQGVVGLFFAIGLIVSLLWRTRHFPVHFAFWIGLAVSGIFNMPLRYAPTAFLCLVMLKGVVNDTRHHS